MAPDLGHYIDATKADIETQIQQRQQAPQSEPQSEQLSQARDTLQRYGYGQWVRGVEVSGEPTLPVSLVDFKSIALKNAYDAKRANDATALREARNQLRAIGTLQNALREADHDHRKKISTHDVATVGSRSARLTTEERVLFQALPKVTYRDEYPTPLTEIAPKIGFGIAKTRRLFNKLRDKFTPLTENDVDVRWTLPGTGVGIWWGQTKD